MLLAAGHGLWAASGSSQSGTLWMTPSRPAGCRTVSPLRNCCPSSRVTLSENGENAPAAMLWLPAEKPSWNGVGGHEPPLPSRSTVKLDPGVAAGRVYGFEMPAYGVIELVVGAAPHASGVASVAFGPGLRFRTKSLNGTCGVSAKVVVSWPVPGSGVTVPFSRTDSPKPLTTTNSRYGLPGSGAPR